MNSEPMGVERLKEALEANDWEGDNDLAEGLNPEDFDIDDDFGSEGEGSTGFGIEATEMEMEMFGMKQAIYGGALNETGENEQETEPDQEVEKLQSMMLKMQAVKGRSPA